MHHKDVAKISQGCYFYNSDVDYKKEGEIIMNVSLSDLVIVVGNIPSCGAVGEAIQFHGDLIHPTHKVLIRNTWVIQFPRKMRGVNTRTGVKRDSYLLLIGDVYLRRISGPELLLDPEEIHQSKIKELSYQ